jgi:hypothetical protein
MPELEGHTVVDILRHVYTTGETFEDQKFTIPIRRSENAPSTMLIGILSASPATTSMKE